MAPLVDSCGLGVSTSSDVVPYWNSALAQFGMLTGRTLDSLDYVVQIAPDFALARALRLVARVTFEAPVDVYTEIKAVRSALCNVTDREMSAVASILELARDINQGVGLALRHMQNFPGDVAIGQFAYTGLTLSGRRGGHEQAVAFAESMVAHAPENPGWRSLLAFALTDLRRYDEARAIAENVLRVEPQCSHAVHAVVHCNYELGEHREGRLWLNEWVQGSSSVPTPTHFQWHLALHDLAVGDMSSVQALVPSFGAMSMVDDGGSLFLRLRLAGLPCDDSFTDRSADIAHSRARKRPPLFEAYNIALAYAAAGRVDELFVLARNGYEDPRPGVAAVLAPVAEALAELVGHRPARAASLLTRVYSELDRLGGSTIQREVVEDALVRALLSCGRASEVGVLMQRRLDRRDLSFYDKRIFQCAENTPDARRSRHARF